MNKQDLMWFIGTSVVVFILLKIAFYKSPMMMVFRLFMGFYFFLLPGFLLTFLIFNKISFLERYFVGSLLGFALMGILSYYLGLITSIHVKFYTPYVSIVSIIIISLLLMRK